jgi:hypothetical protein
VRSEVKLEVLAKLDRLSPFEWLRGHGYTRKEVKGFYNTSQQAI